MGQVSSVIATCFNCGDDHGCEPVNQDATEEELHSSRGGWMRQNPQAAPGRRWDANLPWMEEESFSSSSFGRYATLPSLDSPGYGGSVAEEEDTSSECETKFHEFQQEEMEVSSGSLSSISSKMSSTEMSTEAGTPMGDDQKWDEEQLQQG